MDDIFDTDSTKGIHKIYGANGTSEICDMNEEKLLCLIREDATITQKQMGSIFGIFLRIIKRVTSNKKSRKNSLHWKQPYWNMAGKRISRYRESFIKNRRISHP